MAIFYIDRPQVSENWSIAELQGTISVSQLFFFFPQNCPHFSYSFKTFYFVLGYS